MRRLFINLANVQTCNGNDSQNVVLSRSYGSRPAEEKLGNRSFGKRL